MRKILEQKTLWIGLGCLILAILLVCVGLFVHPGGKVMDRLQKAINKSDADTYLECFLPEERDSHTQEELLLLKTEMQFLSEGTEKKKILFFEGEDKADDLGRMEPYCIYIVREGDSIVDAYCERISVQVVDGREYLTDY